MSSVILPMLSVFIITFIGIFYCSFEVTLSLMCAIGESLVVGFLIYKYRT